MVAKGVQHLVPVDGEARTGHTPVTGRLSAERLLLLLPQSVPQKCHFSLCSIVLALALSVTCSTHFCTAIVVVPTGKWRFTLPFRLPGPRCFGAQTESQQTLDSNAVASRAEKKRTQKQQVFASHWAAHRRGLRLNSSPEGIAVHI